MTCIGVSRVLEMDSNANKVIWEGMWQVSCLFHISLAGEKSRRVKLFKSRKGLLLTVPCTLLLQVAPSILTPEPNYHVSRQQKRHLPVKPSFVSNFPSKNRRSPQKFEQ
jgi:hypothetical protein